MKGQLLIIHLGRLCLAGGLWPLVALGQTNYVPYVFTTLAGSAFEGNADGPVAVARFQAPHGVVADGSGNLYVADTVNNTIRKITPEGMVSTVAGQAGMAGSVGGVGTLALLSGPYGLALDAAGNLYVSEPPNCTIRKITPSLEVSTLAGLAGTQGWEDGTGSDARFSSPAGVAVDKAGNVYVADMGCWTIRKITPLGVVTTIAGMAYQGGTANGTGNTARFWGPMGVAIDGNANIYVTDTWNQTIRKITSGKNVSTLAGLAGAHGSADGTGNAAQFNNPSGLAVDGAGNLYVSDTDNGTIRKITPAGVVTTLAGLAAHPGYADGQQSAARFFGPAGLTVDGAGTIYVADDVNDSIRKITPDGVITTVAGQPGSRGCEDGPETDARFYGPYGVAVDGSGNTYVTDLGNSTIRRISPAGVVSTVAGLAQNPGSADGVASAARFNGPWSVAMDKAGQVDVADGYNHTIRRITPDGTVSTLAGRAGSPGSADGTLALARFNRPLGVAMDSAGTLYVADAGNATIRQITPDGMVSTVAGSAHSPGTADGKGSLAQFDYPSGVAVDGTGNLYVADSGNHAIRKVLPDGTVVTLAGLTGLAGYTDDTGTAARFKQPFALALDPIGNV